MTTRLPGATIQAQRFLEDFSSDEAEVRNRRGARQTWLGQLLVRVRAAEPKQIRHYNHVALTHFDI